MPSYAIETEALNDLRGADLNKDSRREILRIARSYLRKLALNRRSRGGRGVCTADDARAFLKLNKYRSEDLGGAAGALFTVGPWISESEVMSTVPSNRGRMIAEWVYLGP